MGSSGFPQWKKYVLEFAGTSAITFFGPATIVAGLLVPGLDGTTRLFFDALVPGITLATCIATFAKYSGSHVNPAITVTFTSSGSFKGKFVLPYFASQLMGGILAGFALWAIFQNLVPSAYLGSNRIASGVVPVEAIALEIAGSMLLCIVVLVVVAKVNGAGKQGILVGVTLSVLIFALGPVSGGSFNPIRSLGPALFSGQLDEMYLYLTTPIVGGALAGLLFRSFQRRLR